MPENIFPDITKLFGGKGITISHSPFHQNLHKVRLPFLNSKPHNSDALERKVTALAVEFLDTF
jgi:hypothetical protein